MSRRHYPIQLRTTDKQNHDVLTEQRRDGGEAYREALAKVDGDGRRLRVEDDGRITILNRPRTALTSPFR